MPGSTVNVQWVEPVLVVYLVYSVLQLDIFHCSLHWTGPNVQWMNNVWSCSATEYFTVYQGIYIRPLGKIRSKQISGWKFHKIKAMNKHFLPMWFIASRVMIRMIKLFVKFVNGLGVYLHIPWPGSNVMVLLFSSSQSRCDLGTQPCSPSTETNHQPSQTKLHGKQIKQCKIYL